MYSLDANLSLKHTLKVIDCYVQHIQVLIFYNKISNIEYYFECLSEVFINILYSKIEFVNIPHIYFVFNMNIVVFKSTMIRRIKNTNIVIPFKTFKNCFKIKQNYT